MTRSSPVWLPVGFVIAVIGVGFKYWQLPAAQAGLPAALWGPGLAAVAVVAMLLRAFGTGRFLNIWLAIAASVPLVVLVRIARDASQDPAVHDAWLRELAIAAGLGLASALVGVAIGSLFLLRSSRRPQ